MRHQMYKSNWGAIDYRGVGKVWWRDDKYTSNITIMTGMPKPHMRHVTIHIGTFKTPEDAALAWDAACYEWYGEKRRLNFPEELK